MQAIAELKAARPASQPKMLLFLADLPPVDSMKEMLGSKRQSSA
jgi:hypothetical protein